MERMNLLSCKDKFKIAVATSNRADFGILLPLLRRLNDDGNIDLKLLVTGTHLAKEYGYTITEIEESGIPIAAHIPILAQGNSPKEISQTVANAITGFAEWFAENRVDLLIVLGDRTEMLGVCIAAMMEGIPIAHIAGGEYTAGAVDDSIRHSITKMAALHFASTDVYRRRIIQLGENPQTVYNVGSLSAENILREKFFSREELLASVGIFSCKPLVVVTYHPVTREKGDVDAEIDELLGAMETKEEFFYLITKSNADVGGERINARMAEFEKKVGKEQAILVDSLGMKRYLSAVKNAVFILGNSSSGFSEAPVLGTPTVNIGNRQKGRIVTKTIINCPMKNAAIVAAMDKAVKTEHMPTDLYGDGHTSEKMLAIIKEVLAQGKLKAVKEFYDIDY